MTEVIVSKSELKKLVKIKNLVEAIIIVSDSNPQSDPVLIGLKMKLQKTVLKYNCKHTINEPF